MEESQETRKIENHLSSAAAFVEGGIQESCNDACSICLEEFCESDPSTVIHIILIIHYQATFTGHESGDSSLICSMGRGV